MVSTIRERMLAHSQHSGWQRCSEELKKKPSFWGGTSLFETKHFVWSPEGFAVQIILDGRGVKACFPTEYCLRDPDCIVSVNKAGLIVVHGPHERTRWCRGSPLDEKKCNRDWCRAQGRALTSPSMSPQGKAVRKKWYGAVMVSFLSASDWLCQHLHASLPWLVAQTSFVFCASHPYVHLLRRRKGFLFAALITWWFLPRSWWLTFTRTVLIRSE